MPRSWSGRGHRKAKVCGCPGDNAPAEGKPGETPPPRRVCYRIVLKKMGAERRTSLRPTLLVGGDYKFFSATAHA
ncbi:unnamed protein product [Boreogadus saida]